MSRLNALILKSFLLPFVTTFFIAWFVLLMQFLWFFMEKIAGKGLAFGLVLELIAYRSVALLPLAIPLAALIAGVMVVGALAEHYELAAVYSAGKSLRRVLAPLAVAGILLSAFSYLTADYLIPAANFRFFERLGDVQRKKPDLSIEAGVFNEDLAEFNVYAAKRDPVSGDLLEVRIYDQHGYPTIPRINQIVAARGSFSSGATDSELLLTLQNGHHLREENAGVLGGKFTRTEFKTYQLSFDLSQFDLQDATDLSGSDHYALLPSWELKLAADSIATGRRIKRNELSRAVVNLTPSAKSSRGQSRSLRPAPYTIQPQRPSGLGVEPGTPDVLPPGSYRAGFLQQSKAHKKATIQSVRNKIRGVQRRARAVVSHDGQEVEIYERYRFERQAKFGLASVCLLFVLVGGSTGAVVRKGGFGYPLLVGVGCFVSYILILEFCRRLMKAGVFSGPVAAWVPTALLLLVMVFVYRRASRRLL